MAELPHRQRYSDQEVALVLRRAAELEEQRGESGAARGLTQHELEGIAREVGFSAEAVRQALAELRVRGTPTRWLGQPAGVRIACAVPGRLTRDAMQRFTQTLEDHVSATGTVTEALGTVRWTTITDGSRDFRMTQVAITPTDDETHLQVTSRISNRLRVVLQLVPVGWGAIIGVGVAGSNGLAAAATLALTLGGAVAGGAIGRWIWERIARSNRRRAERLTDSLAQSASDLISSQ